MQCPRDHCKGQVSMEPADYNVWTCLLCARQYMKLDGRLVALERTGTEPYDERVGARTWRQGGKRSKNRFEGRGRRPRTYRSY